MSTMKSWLKQYRRNFRYSLFVFLIVVIADWPAAKHHYIRTALTIFVLSLILALFFSIMDKLFDGFWYHLIHGKKKPKE